MKKKLKDSNLIENLITLTIYAVITLIAIPTILNAANGYSETSIVTKGSDMVLAGTYTKYDNGTAIYFNPNTGTTCNQSDAVSTTGTRSGCMKWYTFNDSDTSSTVNMILDHNTTSTCTYEGLETHLTGDTSEWKSNLKARNITANEIAQIVGHTSWNSDTAGTSNWFYFDSLNQTQVANASNPSSYAWLFNNLNQSKTYGGTEEDNNAYNYSYYNSTSNGSTAIATTYVVGYWTANDVATDSARAWRVGRYGYLHNSTVSTATGYGVRPVITVSKSLLG